MLLDLQNMLPSFKLWLTQVINKHQFNLSLPHLSQNIYPMLDKIN